jgi:hypothetical protein
MGRMGNKATKRRPLAQRAYSAQQSYQDDNRFHQFFWADERNPSRKKKHRKQSLDERIRRELEAERDDG